MVLDRLKEVVPAWVPAGCAEPGADAAPEPGAAVLTMAPGGQFSLSIPLALLGGDGTDADGGGDAVIETVYSGEESKHLLTVNCPARGAVGQVVLMDTSGQVWQQQGFDFDKIRSMVDGMVERLQAGTPPPS